MILRRIPWQCAKRLPGDCLFHASSAAGDRFQSCLDLLGLGARDLLDDLAVFQEDQRGPELDTVRTAQRPTFAVFNLDVPNIGMLL